MEFTTFANMISLTTKSPLVPISSLNRTFDNNVVHLRIKGDSIIGYNYKDEPVATALTEKKKNLSCLLKICFKYNHLLNNLPIRYKSSGSNNTPGVYHE